MPRLGFLILFFVVSVVANAQAASPGFTKIANVPTGTTYTDSTCANQTTCYYQVMAVDGSGHEAAPALCASNGLCFAQNQAVATMPSSGTHTVVLNWVASTQAGVTYNVYRAVGPVAASSLAAVVN